MNTSRMSTPQAVRMAGGASPQGPPPMTGDVDEHADGSSWRPPAFELVVTDAFHLRDRGGIAVVGPAPASGMVRSGDAVEIVREGRVIGETTAYVELHARPGHVALFIPDPAADVRTGDRVRRRDDTVAERPAIDEDLSTEH